MTRPRRVQAVLAVALSLAALTVPVRMVLGEPRPRLTVHAVAPPGVIALPSPASHLGAAWTGDDDAVVELRWRASAAGPWSPWEALGVAHDLGDEQTGLRRSGLLTVTEAATVGARV
ncbi:MAG: hypothetical protein ACRD0D_14205, partial [Acidimicrobiales bacterium]